MRAIIPNAVNADGFDIQTGTGGGRITGSLDFGKKLSLRKAHTNHVHLAGMLPPDRLVCVFYIVQAIETVILDSGLELRANESLLHVFSPGGNSGADLSPYADQSDSLLQEKEAGQSCPALQRQQFLQDTAELAAEFGSAKDVYDAMDCLEGNRPEQMHAMVGTPAESERICQKLNGMGIATMNGDRPVLTAYGRELKAFLAHRLPDAESYIRRMYRIITPGSARCGRTKALLAPGEKGHGRRILLSEGSGEVALPETVLAAARRLAAAPGGDWRINQADIRRSSRRTECKAEICLLIDASASMSGQRINAAKYLVRHLLLTTPDRICVILFQEDRATVQVPFTRDYGSVQKSLQEITAIGSTPLGRGLKTCLEYLDTARPQRPLILLVTDGVPTFADGGGDPLAEAIAAAGQIRAKGYGFTCIGLRPHRDYLRKLSQAAGGKAYMMDELEKQALVQAVWQR